MNKITTASKVRLSLEPAFQLIYWSICWLALFLGLILILEKQQSIHIIISISLFIVLVYFGLGSTATISEGELTIRYFRGLKRKSYPLSLFSKLSFPGYRLIKLERGNTGKPLILYANKRNKKVFSLLIQQQFPERDEVAFIKKNDIS
ncbi:EbsA family protein [Carnobacterium sp.]|uniref:EbsA family protein n=1 Tax=Carnobacterium sp. TaxID=48221 RepID=UPI003C75566B